MPLSIKKLGPADVVSVSRLFYFFQADDGVANPLIPSAGYLDALLARTDFHVIAAFQDDELVGGLTAFELPLYKDEGNEMFLYEIAVEPVYRKKRVATALIEYLKNSCVEKGIKEMYVGTSVNNRPAVKLYRATGGVADTEIAWFVYQCFIKGGAG